RLRKCRRDSSPATAGGPLRLTSFPAARYHRDAEEKIEPAAFTRPAINGGDHMARFSHLRALFSAVLIGAWLSLGGAAHAAWPERPVTIIVPWGAGGAADQLARILASLLEQDLKQPFNVVQRTGGSGVVGHQAMVNAKPDGYTLGLATVEITMFQHQALANFNHRDFTVVAIINTDAGGLMVRTDSPYKTAKQLIDDIKAKPPQTLKASGTGQGGIWHLG